MKSMDLPAIVSAQKGRGGQNQPIDPTSSEPLSKKVVHASVWVFTLRFTNRGLGFVRTIILARLLAPSDFGLLGIAMLAISTLETFSQTGFQAALIQKRENLESYLDTAWTVSVIRGMFLFSVLFFGAPLVAKFFNSPEATLIIRVIAVTVLLTGLRNIGIVFFQKELEFNKQFFYEFSATIVDLSVAVALAFILRNVWALVWGGLAAHCVRVFMSYMVQSYRPRIRFNKAKFHELLGFGKWILGSSILVFLITQGDDILVGKMLGVTALGLYQMAYLISNLPATEITHVISQVTFPAYSKLQDDLPKLREAYLKVLKLTAFISLPLAGGIFILAQEFTQIFLGAKWMPMVLVAQVLALAGVARSIAATSSAVFSGIGKPEMNIKWQVLRLVVLVAFILPLTAKRGIVGAALAVAISYGASVFKLVSVAKVIGCEIKALLQPIWHAAVFTGAAASITKLITYMYEVNGIIDVLLIASIAICCYGVTVFFYYTDYAHKLWEYSSNWGKPFSS